jgi:hypothetical protein
MADFDLKNYIKNLNTLARIDVSKHHKSLILYEYPFDGQLLSLSSLYRKSRKLFCSLGGVYSAKICSTMRSLSAHDLFADEIEFTPSASEILWFKDHFHEVVDPELEIETLLRFNEISIFHEQNHRIVWRLLPPAPQEKRDLCRYLNFAESLVVILDLALGDEIGKKYSPIFEKLRVIYRPGGQHKWFEESTKEIYRNYLLALMCTTYFALELINYEDILAAVNFVLPNQKKINREAVTRGLELSELFSRITNPQWQERYWKKARIKLKKIHHGSQEDTLYLPEDPLNLSEEFHLARRVFDCFGL